MVFNYSLEDASTEKILALLDEILFNSNIPEIYKPQVQTFYEIWKSHLTKGEFISFENVISNPLREEIFPLEHYISPHKFVCHFHISSVRHLLQHGTLRYQNVPLSSCKDILHYTEMPVSANYNNFNFSPVIAVPMFSQNDAGNITTCEIIDGNHRVSEAIKFGKDLMITFVMSNFLPPMAFINKTSWILYHILTGRAIIGSELADTQKKESYLQALDLILTKSFLPR